MAQDQSIDYEASVMFVLCEVGEYKYATSELGEI